jgi:hypothetical protein
MNIINPGAGPGSQDASVTNGAFLGGNVVQVNSGTAGQISMPFRVEIGDQLRVSIASYVSRNGVDARVTHRFREFTHRPGSASPFTVIALASGGAATGQINVAKSSHIIGVGNEDFWSATVTVDVVATAHDAVFNFDIFTDTGQSALLGNEYVKIERV